MTPPCTEQPDIFFDKDSGPAKRVCLTCPIRETLCLELTRQIEIACGRQDGVWAGLTERQRRRRWSCREELVA